MSTDNFCEEAPCSSLSNESPTLHEVLRGEPDPRLVHLRTFLALLGCPTAGVWLEAAKTMADALSMARVDELRPMLRLDAREGLDELVDAAKRIIAFTDRADVLEALRVLAPVSEREPDDVTGYEYLTALACRAETAAATIRAGSGRDTFLTNLGYPTARLLCATMVRTAWKQAAGKVPNDKHAKALEACAALWRATDEAAPPRADANGSDEVGAWERHLRDARIGTKNRSAALNARQTAVDCLGALRQKAP